MYKLKVCERTDLEVWGTIVINRMGGKRVEMRTLRRQGQI